MNTIHIVGAADCDGADVETDPWIPLKVSWWPRAQVQPLYMRITGTSGGEVELKVDPATGALLQVIVIDEPPASDLGTSRSDGALLNKTPVLDRSAWGLGDEDQGFTEEGSVVTVTQELAFNRGAEVAALRFSDGPVAELMRCDDVTVGISADRALVSIEARLAT